MRGDRVEIVVDTGEAGVREFEVVATKAGRRVEVTVARGTVEVSEVTRTGQPVRSARFMQTRVIALVEHPASGDSDSDEGPRPSSRRRRPSPDQAALDLGG